MSDLGEQLLEAAKQDGVDPENAADYVLGFDAPESK